MHQLPALPAGWLAQPLWERQHGGRSYEFALVYDAAGRLDRGRCYWMVLTPGAGEAAFVRHVDWARLRRMVGRRAPSFAKFSSSEAPFEHIDLWLRCGEPEAAAPPSPSEIAEENPQRLPWSYFGWRRARGGWIPLSGYLPSDGEDTGESARDAAALMEADAVLLEDASHRMLSVRDAGGLPLGEPPGALMRH